MVKKYYYGSCKPELTVEQYIKSNDTNNIIEYFYCMDCPDSDAFAHWIYETFIFYPIIKELTLL
jgi:hypothetical protein